MFSSIGCVGCRELACTCTAPVVAHKVQGRSWDDMLAYQPIPFDPYADDPRWSRPIILRSPAWAAFMDECFGEHLKAIPDA